MPPAPGIMANRVSGSPTMAEDPKTRREAQSPSSKPPPRAIDDMAEIVGIGRLDRFVNVPRRVLRKALVLLDLSPRLDHKKHLLTRLV